MMETKRDNLKEELLKKYSGKDPHPFYQFDGFDEGEFNYDVLTGDDAGDSINNTVTYELMSGIADVRVLINPKTQYHDVIRLLEKILEWIKEDGLGSVAKELKRQNAWLDQPICPRCRETNKHHQLCGTSLTDAQLQEVIKALHFDIPF
jgi:hypothetical protein